MSWQLQLCGMDLSSKRTALSYPVREYLDDCKNWACVGLYSVRNPGPQETLLLLKEGDPGICIWFKGQETRVRGGGWLWMDFRTWRLDWPCAHLQGAMPEEEKASVKEPYPEAFLRYRKQRSQQHWHQPLHQRAEMVPYCRHGCSRHWAPAVGCGTHIGRLQWQWQNIHLALAMLPLMGRYWHCSQ